MTSVPARAYACQIAMQAHEAIASNGTIDWDALGPGAEMTATVLMASGFVLSADQRVQERYRVERRLGEGGMGQVLAVTLIGSDDAQRYALKVVARSVAAADPGELQKATEIARREAASFAEILRAEGAKQEVAQRHGVSVARLFALVQLEDGSLGLRMELARGRSLETQLAIDRRHADAEPDVAAAIRIVRKLLGQLRRLHELRSGPGGHGFVHSDVKPGNVFVDDTDPDDIVITLLDFGVATAGQAMVNSLAAIEGGRRTLMVGYTGGTLGYVPPYHFTAQATSLSDVYAAFVILYELIALELPWVIGAGAVDASRLQVVRDAMLKGPASLRSQRPSLNAQTAELLDAFFAREFSKLNELSSSVSEGMASGDETLRANVDERLRGLAREYQKRIDELEIALFPGRPHAAPRETIVEPVEPAELAMRPTVRSDPGWRPTPAVSPLEMPWTDEAPAAGASAADSLMLPRDSQLPSAPEHSFRWDSATAKDGALAEAPSAPAERTKGHSVVLFSVALLLVAGGAGGAWVYLRSRANSHGGPDRSRPASAGGAGVAASPLPGADASVALGAALNVVSATADATPSATGREDGSAIAAGATADAAPSSTTDASGAAAPGGENNPAGAAVALTRCVAPMLGATVIVHAGPPRGDVVVCRVTTPMPQRTGYFMGTGSAPATVGITRDNVVCRDGSFALEVSVLQFPSERGGSMNSFECERPAGGPSAPVSGATGATPGGAQGTGGAAPSSDAAAAGAGAGATGAQGSGGSPQGAPSGTGTNPAGGAGGAAGGTPGAGSASGSSGSAGSGGSSGGGSTGGAAPGGSGTGSGAASGGGGGTGAASDGG